ncbi:MAG: 50S ribosomal protein L19 [Candidatus Vogelbacteria bacterium]|nr:50S ribosomal protein L19 [Candidatus Vogelbacteria bacterium]
MKFGNIQISPVDMEKRQKLNIKSGDTVIVSVKIKEKDKDKIKTRIQDYEGLVIARKHGNEAGGTFTVRKVASGVGMERIFPLYSPVIDTIEIKKRSRVRRAKLYYVHTKAQKEISRKMRRTVKMEEANDEAMSEDKKETE